MKEFKILDNPEESFYFGEIYVDEDSGKEEPHYDTEQSIFASYTRQKFLQEVRNQSNTKKQAGYSKTRNCKFISLILVCHNSGDGAFDGHSIKKTYIIENNNKTEDAYKNRDQHGEIGWSYRAAYHVLPDGKLLEFNFKQSYEKEIDFIYEIVSKTRLNYDFENKFPVKFFHKERKNKI